MAKIGVPNFSNVTASLKWDPNFVMHNPWIWDKIICPNFQIPKILLSVPQSYAHDTLKKYNAKASNRVTW